MSRLGLVGGLAVLAACSRGSAKAKADEQGPAKGEVKELAPVVPEPPPEEQILAIDGFDEAVAFAKPMMADGNVARSKGDLMLTFWSATKLRWTDVAVAKNETSVKLVNKDSDEQRGKRMCLRGQIAQITKVNNDPKFYSGLMFVTMADRISFNAVGSTGELVDDSWARFCGVVTQRYGFDNVSGGTTLTVAMVGMFDLPENKSPAPAKP
jgi:hypothetical protein